MPQSELETPAPQGFRPDAPAYGVRGQHPVGVRDFSIAAAEHTVDASLWYPALNPAGEKEEITYVISDKSATRAKLPVFGHALLDAQPDTAQGPYPLVIYSPGLSAWRQTSTYLLEHLASRGFAVMASDTRGESFTDFWQGAATRPLDMQAIIAFADSLTANGGELGGLLDMQHVAVVGHSSGGWAALVGGGAQMHFGWGDAHPDLVAENSLSNLSQFVSHADEIASLLGLEGVPQGLWPPQNDLRVKAVVALAPDGDIWGATYEGVAAVKVPALIMTGGGDNLNVPENCAYPIYRHLGSSKKTLVTFAHAGHMIFFDQSRNMPWMVHDGFWACSDPVWDMDRAHDLINHFITAFLLAELKADAGAAEALAPENVAFPGIQYEASRASPAA